MSNQRYSPEFRHEAVRQILGRGESTALLMREKFNRANGYYTTNLSSDALSY